jgi:GxxExxY protein
MLLHGDLTDEILDAFFGVYNELGYGFLEKVYQNALYFELKERRLEVVAQQRWAVRYKGREVGEYYSDLTVNGLVILELKACETILAEHQQQLQNYLKASTIEVGLLLNFGKRPEFIRKIFTNQNKSLIR